MPVEGGARVAIIEAADRMNEDAQSALLKTLEEPPAGVTIVLCADQEARLLPTVRSRCFRVRLGLVGPRDIEAILADHGLVDPPTAARLGRLAGGRPGLAMAYARAPEAVLIRAELTPRAARPDRRRRRPPTGGGSRRRPARDRAGRRAGRGRHGGPAGAGPAARPGRRRGQRPPTPVPAEPAPAAPPADETADDAADRDRTRTPRWPIRTPATERRRGVEVLLGLWTDVARDLVLIGHGGVRSVHDTVLLDELAAVAATIDPGAAVAFLDRAARSAEMAGDERVAGAHPRRAGARLAAPRDRAA